MDTIVRELEEKVLSQQQISRKEALLLLEASPRELYKSAEAIRRHFMGSHFDLCSIINARSGNCTENCQFCAQSARHHTGVATYKAISEDEAMAIARDNDQHGVHRLSLVTSGRSLSPETMEEMLHLYQAISEETSLRLCASAGFLDAERAQTLRKAGVERYHCNLEANKNFFPQVCTSHTWEEKVATLKLAQDVGMSLCSGGIIGMGESMEDRIDLALELRELGVKSIPINILTPIPGTPLANLQALELTDVLVTIALFRFINPDAVIRMAGGRQQLGKDQYLCFKVGANGAIVGNYLTTTGSGIITDIQHLAAMGFTFTPEVATNTIADMLRFDRKHIWHPYTSMTKPLPVYPVKSASGVRLRLENGRELIDGMSSWWCAIHGYSHPALNNVLREQAERMSHVMFGGLTHEPAVRLAELLVELSPQGLDKVFFSDSGSVSVEVALKMALQYQQAAGQPERHRLLTVRGGYHGDTFHAMSVCDPVTGMHSLFNRSLPQQLFAPRPQCRFDGEWDEQDLQGMAELLERHHKEVAAVIIEPIVQGAGGMWFYHPNYLRGLRRLCDQYQTLLIFDEIATGFGRTGVFFAAEHAGVAPDIMCLGKSLTGGYMTLAATLATTQIAETISAAEPGVFMHGPTFMANPLACQVACFSTQILLDTPWQMRVDTIAQQLAEELEPARTLPNVEDVRVLGAIGVIETKKPVDMATLQQFFVRNGVWVRPFGRLLYLMPPYIIQPEELQRLTSALVQAAELDA